MKVMRKIAAAVVLVMLLTGCSVGNTSTTPTEEQPYLGEWYWEGADLDTPGTKLSVSVVLSENMTFTAEYSAVGEYEYEEMISGGYELVMVGDKLEEFDGDILEFYYDEADETLHYNVDTGWLLTLKRPK